MSTENIVSKKFRILTDAVNKVYDRCSFWTKASDVEFTNGNNAQTTLGSITGISDSLTSTSSNVAASAASVKALNDKITELSSNLDCKTIGTTIGSNKIDITDYIGSKINLIWLVNRNGLRYYGTIPMDVITTVIGTQNTATSFSFNGGSHPTKSDNMWNCTLKATRDGTNYYVQVSSLTYNGTEYVSECNAVWYVKG